MTIRLATDIHRRRSIDRLHSQYARLDEAVAGFPDVVPATKENPGFDDRISKHTLLGSIVRAVRDAKAMHSGEMQRNFAIFVSPEYSAFWSQNKLCWAQPFVLPATTGMPMLFGLPPKRFGCNITKDYGYAAYDISRSSSNDFDDSQLCEAASQRNFGGVFIVLGFENYRFLECQASGN